jgi:site-specific DNA-methyltransferase (adenine-specific)
MLFLDHHLIEIPIRQRRERPRGFIERLKASIVSKGLLHPIVLSRESLHTGHLKLVAGEGRLIAMVELHTDGIEFRFENEKVLHGLIPYVTLSDLTPDMVAEAELEENLIRAALTWQEEVEAKLLIHNMRKRQNPQQTIRATASEMLEIKEEGTLRGAEEALTKSILVGQHMHNPRVRAAKTLNEACKVALDDNENMFRAGLLELGAINTQHTLIKGDLLEELAGLPAGAFDAIIVDPPYGIDADKYKTPTKVAGEKKQHEGHFYQDSPAYSDKICATIFEQGFRLLRSQGLLFMFCDPDRFHSLRTMALAMAYSVWRTPLIWKKEGAQSGFAPWGSGGFIRSYEMILMASKGQKTLTIPGGPDVFSFPRVHHTERQHAAEKPVELYSWLLQRSCIPGDTVLDPCCGSGPIFTAAENCKVAATGIEIDAAYHAQAAARIMAPVEPAEDDDEKLWK